MGLMEITKDTRISAIHEEYGDIADVMEIFGIKRVGRYSLRMLAAKAVTVEWAALTQIRMLGRGSGLAWTYHLSAMWTTRRTLRSFLPQEERTFALI